VRSRAGPQEAATVENSWFHHMRRGDFAAAWEISDTVLRQRAGTACWHLPRHEQYIWDGRPLADRRVLIRCYHGLGDTVMFIRFAPLVKAIAREVIVWAQPALLPLLSTARGIDRLLALHDGVPEVDFDVDVEVMELSHVFRTTPETIPREIPYLHALPAALSRTPGTLNVGLVWCAGDWDGRRSIALPQLAPLLELPHVHWHVLQRGGARREWPRDVGVLSGSDDILATASVMRALDLVISVDSFPAHLAGALGVPVWTLLHSDPDWRWMLGCEDSPWYPTMRLFRQTRAGDWPEVIARAADELRSVTRRQAG
jgi:hypothetical protein